MHLRPEAQLTQIGVVICPTFVVHVGPNVVNIDGHERSSLLQKTDWHLTLLHLCS